MRNLRSILVTVAIVLIALTTSCTKTGEVTPVTLITPMEVTYLFHIEDCDTSVLEYYETISSDGSVKQWTQTEYCYEIKEVWTKNNIHPRIKTVVNNSCLMNMVIIVNGDTNNIFNEYVGAGEYYLTYK